ncbi:MAG: thiamine pyrophosphokinase [Anaerolineaceae bacterium]|nr:MAG: thiamine pyrophosphokinase [Anaerolineaceae bacterium]
MPSRAIIFANGSLPDPSTALGAGLEPVRRLIQPGDLLLAADGGTRRLRALGLVPSAIIGDLDSLTADDRRWADERQVRLVAYPPDKNETDLELALAYAVEQGADEIVIAGALGGRLDQTLANLALLTDPRLAALDVRLDDGVEAAWFVRGRTRVEGSPGDIVSLLPWGRPVTGIVTDGLRWPLRGETLTPEKTRGISNEMLGGSASVSIESGLLLVVHRRLNTEH